jgi:hypothetical protein
LTPKKDSTTLQFYDPHAVSGSAGSATKVRKKVKEWLSAITLRNPNIVIQTKSGKALKLTEYPDTEEAAFHSTFSSMKPSSKTIGMYSTFNKR